MRSPLRSGCRPAPRHRLRDERGIALLIVLVIVALLTITVTEFTFSVQVDQHRTRNAIHALQSQLLARSGINIMEGFVVMDTDAPPTNGVTWKGEDWWMQLQEFCKNLQIDESTIIRCKVIDDSGRINVNNTRPVATRPGAAAAAASKDAILRDAIRCILRWKLQDDRAADRLREYWDQEPPQRSDNRLSQVPEFETLEDYAQQVGLTKDELSQVRRFLTVRPAGAARLLPINANTAPPEVLAAVIDPENCNGAEKLAPLQEKRNAGDPIMKADLATLKPDGDDKNWAVKISLLGTDSNFYRLEASALSNIDPEHPESGGIGQTLSALVERRKRPNSGQFIQGGPPIWTLRLLDWQKEGGARLFHDVQPEEDEMGGMGDEETTDQQQQKQQQRQGF